MFIDFAIKKTNGIQHCGPDLVTVIHTFYQDYEVLHLRNSFLKDFELPLVIFFIDMRMQVLNITAN